MGSKRYEVAIVIGRFHIAHEGHVQLFEMARDLADKVVIGLGSANVARSIINPFTAEERINMLKRLPSLKDGNIAYLQFKDYPARDHRWIGQALEYLEPILDGVEDNKVCIVTHTKEGENNIANYFPRFHAIEVDNHRDIHATSLREQYFQGIIPDFVCNNVEGFLEEFTNTETYAELRREYEWLRNYNDKLLPTFPRNEQTADAVVIQNGHVLMIQRKDIPGKGQWALPGGFVGPEETVYDACIRELLEETRLKVPEKVLRARTKDKNGIRFDNPRRSLRGRIITTAFLIQLASDEGLSKVRGGDDAAAAKWVPLYAVPKMSLFEDHGLIVETLTRNI